MKLLIDAGNTRVKWRAVSALDDRYTGFVGSADREELVERLSSLPPIDGVYVSSVLDEEFNRFVAGLCARLWSLEPLFAKVADGCLGVRPAYSDLSALGVDRWLGMLAAARVYPGQECVVVGAGSALTADVLMADGRHLGGWIAPGVGLLDAALGSKVAFAKSGERWSFSSESLTSPQKIGVGSSTVECVQLGLLSMLVGFFRQLLVSVGGLIPEGVERVQFIVAGGDAQLVASALMSIAPGLSVSVQPELVLDGLEAWSTVS